MYAKILKRLVAPAIFSLAILFLIPISKVKAAVPAFPGAEGFGADTQGGRGGTVYEVTNTNDSGSGSLRACMTASGPRICIIKTSGWINLVTPITVTSPYLTVAGQTAPDIFGLRIHPNASMYSTMVNISTHDVVIRYLTLRSGPGANSASSVDNLGGAVNNSTNLYNIIFDHVSTSWAVDQNMGTWYRVRDFTLQWNASVEGLNFSTHEKVQPHSKGPILGSAYLNADKTDSGAYNFSVHHNLFAHNGERNPLMDMSGRADIINNLTYNHGGNRAVMLYAREAFTQAKYNLIKNFTKPGPNSYKPYTVEAWYYPPAPISWSLYVEGNLDGYRTTGTEPEYYSVSPDVNAFPLGTGGPRNYLSTTRFPAPPIAVTETSATQAYTDVLAFAGNSRHLTAEGIWVPRRDAVDQRIAYEVAHGTGKIIDAPGISSCKGLCLSPEQWDPNHLSVILSASDYTRAGVTAPLDTDGWPLPGNGTPYTDTDHDGISDIWENLKFGNLTMASNTTDYDRDEYTDLEEFLNATEPKGGSNNPTIAPSPTPTPIPTQVVTPGDANRDGKVDNADFDIWFIHYDPSLTQSGGTSIGDFNSNLKVDGLDYVIWVNNYTG